MSTLSESLKISTERYTAHNDAHAPPQSKEESVRALLQGARRHLDRSKEYTKQGGKPSAEIVALQYAVAAMLAALEIGK